MKKMKTVNAALASFVTLGVAAFSVVTVHAATTDIGLELNLSTGTLEDERTVSEGDTVTFTVNSEEKIVVGDNFTSLCLTFSDIAQFNDISYLEIDVTNIMFGTVNVPLIAGATTLTKEMFDGNTAGCNLGNTCIDETEFSKMIEDSIISTEGIDYVTVVVNIKQMDFASETTTTESTTTTEATTTETTTTETSTSTESISTTTETVPTEETTTNIATATTSSETTVPKATTTKSTTTTKTTTTTPASTSTTINNIVAPDTGDKGIGMAVAGIGVSLLSMVMFFKRKENK